YEDYSYCKPSLEYYKQILDKIGLKGEECAMVGNDVGEDMVAKKLGMKTFLLTDCLINRSNEDISIYPHGSFDELTEFINSL
ncbi:MAG: HAD family hydrolase, partial [Oscillospiraceae bacterium]|nr:HAD family hydrolase [Oscillospiraceae bacterium]